MSAEGKTPHTLKNFFFAKKNCPNTLAKKISLDDENC